MFLTAEQLSLTGLYEYETVAFPEYKLADGSFPEFRIRSVSSADRAEIFRLVDKKDPSTAAHICAAGAVTEQGAILFPDRAKGVATFMTVNAAIVSCLADKILTMSNMTISEREELEKKRMEEAGKKTSGSSLPEQSSTPLT